VSAEKRGAQAYFDRVPDEWDALYAHEDPRRYLTNRLLRKGLYERYRFAFDAAGGLEGRTVLDLGCGSGRYAVESAKRGAQRVVGVDFAPAMLDFARRMADEQGVGERCEFVRGDVVNAEVGEHFDVVFALGLFDYVSDPARVCARAAGWGPRAFVASFPKFTPLWGTQRWIRYYLIKHCPVYNYTSRQVASLCRDAGFAQSVVCEGRHGLLAAAGSGPF
jgi:ubiquinone/menaquinone biosynthesis C-methylase UbiE